MSFHETSEDGSEKIDNSKEAKEPIYANEGEDEGQAEDEDLSWIPPEEVGGSSQEGPSRSM